MGAFFFVRHDPDSFVSHFTFAALFIVTDCSFSSGVSDAPRELKDVISPLPLTLV
jgi:hypothetical protein